MNILQVISNLDIPESAGDVIDSTRFFTLNGHKVIVASAKCPLVREIDEVGARHYAIPFRSNFFLIPFWIFKLSKIILKEGIQVVHARDALSSFVAFFAARITDKPLITTAYRYSGNNFLEKTQFWARRVICLSESKACHFVRNGLVTRNKIDIIPPSVYPKGSGSLKPHNLRDYFTIGCVLSSFFRESSQNLIRTLAILSRMINKLKIFIVDDTFTRSKENAERFKLLVKRHSLTRIVSFLPREEAKNFISGLDLFLQIGTDENLSPRFLLQAGALGVPSVITDENWLKSYFEENKVALVPESKTPKGIADAVMGLCRNKKARGQATDKAKKFVKENFSIKKMAERTLKVYEDSVSRRNILIIKIGALGDVILSVPSLRAIREKFPGSTIKLLSGIKNRDVFTNCPFVDEIIICDFEKRDRGITGFLRVAKKLRTENFDMIMDLQNNKKSHLLGFLACAPKRYGYDNGKLSFLLNRKVRNSKIPTGPVEHQSKALGLLGIYNIDKKLELWPSGEDEKWAESFLKSHWIQSKSGVIAFNIGSSPRWITKMWPVEYCAELCNKLAAQDGIRTIVIGRDRSDRRAKEFLKRAKSKPVNALGMTNIPRLAALLKRCGLVITSDSAPMHVAAGCGTPFIALFGPTDPARHLPPAKKYIVIKKELPCMPCYHAKCDRGYLCMRSIKPDEVYEAAKKILKIRTEIRK